jgi:hypothetical protein
MKNVRAIILPVQVHVQKIAEKGDFWFRNLRFEVFSFPWERPYTYTGVLYNIFIVKQQLLRSLVGGTSTSRYREI